MGSNRIITIARQYGSGGKTVGQMLAKDLGIDCYDREILRMASDDSGLNLQIAINYGSRDEMTRAMRKMADDLSEGILKKDSYQFRSRRTGDSESHCGAAA